MDDLVRDGSLVLLGRLLDQWCGLGKVILGHRRDDLHVGFEREPNGLRDAGDAASRGG
jgi:hypothetical protein